jgi:MFS family permease
LTLPRPEYSLTREIVRLVCGQGGIHACMSGLRMAIPLLALSLGHGAAAVGVLVALFGVGQVAISLPAGRFTDRHGMKAPVRGALVAGLAGALLAAVWPVYPVLCLVALLEGAAIAVAVIALQRHAGRLADAPDELRRVFAWLSFTPAAANFAGPFLAGLAIDAFGFRTAFLLLAAGPILSWLFIRRAHETRDPARTATSAGGVLELWRDPLVRRVLAMNWFISSTWDVHSLMVPLLGHARGLSASSIGGILGAFALAAAVVRLAMPYLAMRVREWLLLAIALALSAVLMGIYPLAQSAWTMALCSVLIGMAVGGVQPLVLTLLHHATPAGRHGQAAALRLLMINASSISMPMLAGSAGGLIGVAGVFWAVCLSLVVGARMAVGLRRML